MDDSETRSLEVDGGEARTIISALESSRATDDRREQERRENIQRHFQTEFGFGNREESDEAGLKDFGDNDDSLLGGSDSQSVELSTEEAKSVVDALSEFNHSDANEEESPDRIREQIESTFEFQNEASK